LPPREFYDPISILIDVETSMVEDKILPLLIAGAAGLISVLAYRRRERLVPQRTTKQVPSCPVASPLNRIVRPFITALLVVSLFYEGAWLLPFHRHGGLNWLGAGWALGAVGLLVWAFQALNEQYNPCTRAYLPDKIVTSGPYRWLRHPIYTANLNFLSGVLFATGSLWMLFPLVAFAILYFVQSRREESALASAFPEYQDYLLQTDWRKRNAGEKSV
jgi:protein-S-isoprenylcysteine O-methyltransferase Ste14